MPALCFFTHSIHLISPCKLKLMLNHLKLVLLHFYELLIINVFRKVNLSCYILTVNAIALPCEYMKRGTLKVTEF